MATRDILVLNTTASRAETQQGGDTVRLKGGGEILAIENSSNVEILTVQTSGSQTTLAGTLLSSTGNISGSASASFGKVEATTLVGSAAFLTNTDLPGTLSSSAQIASKVTGSFRAGFEFTGTISGSIGSTGSFDRIIATTFAGDASNLTNSQKANTLSSSVQIASRISGSFTSGFEFDGKISGSATSTGSFSKLDFTKISGDGSELTNIAKSGTVSSSAQLAADISGSFNKGFNFDGTISSSFSSSADFTTVTAQTLTGDGSGLTNTIPANAVSGSAQLASDISGSFNKGFEFDGTIKTALGTWSAGGTLNTVRSQEGGVGTKAAFIATDDSRKTEIYNGSNWSEVNDMNVGRVQVELAGSSTSALAFGGFGYPMFNRNDSEEWNGTNWSVSTGMPISRSNHSGAGQTDADSALAFGGGSNSSFPTPTDIDTVEWNGSSWTTYSETGLHPACRNGVGFGSTEAALYHNLIAFNKTWDGSSWSSIANSLQGHDKGSGGGTVNDGIVFGGSNSGKCTELYDGTSWSQQGALAADRIYTDGGGTVAGNVLAVGAQSAPQRQTAEHFSLSATTGSFNRVVATTFKGNASNLFNLPLASGIISGAAQLSADISGSFDKGFEFDGSISGSATSTGSFTHIEATTITGDGSGLTHTALDGTVSSSAQLASDICGSVQSGFEYVGCIQGTHGVWSTANGLIVQRQNAGAFGTKTAAIVAGGRSECATEAPSSWPGGLYNTPMGNLKQVESWDGTSFSETTDLIYTRDKIMGAGTTNSGILAGGGTYPNGTVACTETWDGSSWSEEGNMNYCTKYSGDAGDSSESMIVFGGEFATPVSHYVNQAEEFDGTSWSEINSLNVSRTQIASAGNSESAIAIAGLPTPGGHSPGNAFNTEEWNGTNWFNLPNTLMNPFHHTGGTGAGTTNDALAFGGYHKCLPSPYAAAWNSNSQHWDGTAFSFGGKLVQGRSNIAGDGSTGGNGFAAAGGNPSMADAYQSTCMETYEQSFTTASFGHVIARELVGEACTLNNIIPVGGISGRISGSDQIAPDISGSFQGGFEVTGDIRTAKGIWTSGGSLINGRYAIGAVGVQSAMLAGGGANPGTPNYSGIATSEEYNGSVWSETNDMITARSGTKCAGTQNAALIAGGAGDCTHTEEYNGTNYATGGSLLLGRTRGGGAGTQNAGLAAGGYTGAPSPTHRSCTEFYDGAVWSEVANLITAGGHIAGGGSQNSSIMIGRYTPSILNCTELWNGISWYQGSAQVGSATYSHGGGGTVNAATKAGGEAASPVSETAQTERWDGVTWSVDASLPAVIRGNRSGGSTPASHMTFGGENPNGQTNYEYNDYFTTGSFGRIETPNLRIGQDAQLVVKKSLQIPVYATNTGIVSSSAGQVWFTRDTNKLNFTIDVNSWTEVADLIVGRAAGATVGTLDATMVAGGRCAVPGAPYGSKCTELWDGASWSAANAMIDKQNGLGMAGNTSAAIYHQGYPVGNTKNETWNGTNWSEGPDGGHSAYGQIGGGTANAGIFVGGFNGSHAAQDDTTEWDGTAFYAASNMPAGKGSHHQGGTQNATWIAGGTCYVFPATTDVADGLVYDGTTWSESDALPIVVKVGLGTGTTNAALQAGGSPTSPVDTRTLAHEYNGTTWQRVNSLNSNQHKEGGMSGTQASALAVGGYIVGHTEQYVTTAIKTISCDGL